MGISPRDHIGAALSYAQRIVAGEEPAGRYVIAACQRHLEDLERQHDPDFPYRFDPVAGARPCYFLELLPHIKGRWARRKRGDPWAHLIRLEPWQQWLVSTAYGWVEKATGLRRFRTVYIEVPRKNAKSTLTAGLSLYALAADNEPGAEVYSAATTQKQARIVFDTAHAMASQSAGYRRRFGVEPYKNHIEQPGSGSKMEPVSAEATSLDGPSIHFGAIDELHAHKTRSVFDVIETGTGARDQSLLWLITTAGSNTAGICYEQRSYVIKILTKIVEDDTYFGVIYAADPGDDEFDERTWRKANPNYGVSVLPGTLQRLARKAQETPAARNNFRTKCLDVWVNALEGWVEPADWLACGDPTLRLEDFEGQDCVIATDLANKIDIASKAYLFKVEGVIYWFAKHYLPEDRIIESGAQRRAGANSQYAGWAEEGRIITTPGGRISYHRIAKDQIADNQRFRVLDNAFDPWQSAHIEEDLEAEGIEVCEVPANVKHFSEPMKELEAAIVNRELRHDGCPVLAWMVSNVVCYRDAKENVYPRKEAEENKIDGVVAGIMGISRLIYHKPERPSVYEEREARII